MSLSITQTYAKVGVERTPHALTVRTDRAQLEMEQQYAKVQIQTELPRVEIDQYEAFASAGLKKPIDLSREEAHYARKNALQYIGKIASDGDRYASIESGGSPIADIAERDAYPVHEFNIDFIPKARPKINVTGGDVKIKTNANPIGLFNGISYKYTKGNQEIEFRPSELSFYLKQKASLKIEYRQPNIDYKI